MELKDKTAIITGSGRGIGKAIALEFAKHGANVVCTARTEQQINQTAAEITAAGSKAIAIPCDVTDPQDVTQMVSQTISHFGTVDILFNNAGSFAALGPIWQIPPEKWFRDVTINLYGPMLCCQAVLAEMIKNDSGIIINMNGGGSTAPLTGGSGYGCSKAALLRLTDTLAAELKRIDSKVMVFAMGPGFVKTEMTQMQAETKQGREWIPSSKEALDQGKDRPPEDAAKTAVELIKNARPEYNGRIFGTGNDFNKINENIQKIVVQDLLTMRSRPLK